MKNSFNDLNHAEMVEKKKELQERYRKLSFDKVMGHIESPIEIRTTRRSIARLNYKIAMLERQTGEQEAAGQSESEA